jgi:hypothetical protein
LLKKNNANRFSVSNDNRSLQNNGKQNNAFTDFSNKYNKESRRFFSDVVISTVNKIRNEKKTNLGQKDFFFNNFEFHKSNKNNLVVIVSKKFIDISIKNCILKLNKGLTFHENRKSLELKFFKRCSQLVNNNIRQEEKEVSQFYTQNLDLVDNNSFKNASEFLSKVTNNIINQLNSSLFIITQNLNTFKINQEDENYEPDDNLENQNNKFTKSFFSEKVINTITQIKLDNENLEYKFNVFTKGFFNDKIRNTISSIDSDSLITNENKDKNNLELEFNKRKINLADQILIKNSEEAKIINSNNLPIFEHRRSLIKSPEKNQNKELIKRLLSKLDEKIDKKSEEEIARKSKIAKQKLLQEKQEIEKEIELSKVKHASNNFWSRSFDSTMVKYNVYQEKYVKNVLKIQSYFRMNLWRFIFKIELMNVRLQRENERAMAARRKKKSIIFLKLQS